ncbi:NUDIX domain-containing protein [Rubellimicrobium rubrum]|uniref:NUDIX domain-containing protein n=1 Tax=Rubellimicrobium rubrum TaxID=2585369 RepID=A0A5C4N3A6_9RHOB|nr:NUDIX domain-containing protein [Rubellimicrobium rubrum]TNC50770.1 NUDIX domain-containing protein [Rubellimicrobium rubrum]
MSEIPVRCRAVSVVALRRKAGRNEVLLLRRTGSLRGEWCQIAGGIENGETAWQTALREMREETGLVPQALYSADICEQFYEADQNSISLLPVFLAMVAADQLVALNHEHSEFRWLEFDAAVALVPFSGQRSVLRHIERDFANGTPSEHLRIL